jgi:hypothetical protein
MLSPTVILRVERGERILEDDLHVALRVAQARAVEPCQVGAEQNKSLAFRIGRKYLSRNQGTFLWP